MSEQFLITLAQLNPTVGDVAGNAAKARRARAQARVDGADLILFPELFIAGYPPEDLVLKPAFQSACRAAIEELTVDYSSDDHGIELRQIAGGYRMSTKPEQHDLVRSFAKSLKPPVRLSFPALETLAVIAYKQPVTVPEISEIRGVDAGGVIATLLDRKLITTAGRKEVIGRPILYKTTKEFLLRFGLKDVNELPSMEEFEKLISESFQSDLLPAESPQAPGVPSEAAAGQSEPGQVEAGKTA
jgi:segregation and condensation protein B